MNMSTKEGWFSSTFQPSQGSRLSRVLINQGRGYCLRKVTHDQLQAFSVSLQVLKPSISGSHILPGKVCEATRADYQLWVNILQSASIYKWSLEMRIERSRCSEFIKICSFTSLALMESNLKKSKNKINMTNS